MVDAVLRFRRSRDMETHDVAGLVQLLRTMNRFHVRCYHCFIRTVRIVGIYLHAEALCDARYVTTYVAERMNTQFLAFELGARCTVVQVTYGIHHHTKCQLCYRIAVLTRRVHRYHLVSRSSLQIDIIISGSGTNHDLQRLGRVQHSGIHNIRTDDQRVGIGNSLQELCLVSIFLEQCQFISGALYHFTNAVNGYFRKRFLCCN